MNKTSFGKTQDGTAVDLYTLTNANGIEVAITNFGAIVTAIRVPGPGGEKTDVALGFDKLDGYLGEHPYFGAVVGRYGNRIANGKFTLNGKQYTLATNNGPNSLHGGKRGFDKRVWTAKQTGDAALELHYTSPDGEEGYPGTLHTTVLYTLTDANELRIDYTLSSEADTVANVTNHSYFNMVGQGDADVLGHEVTINADRFTPTGKTLIPTGELKSVAGTPFDFRQPHTIGERINANDDQLKYAGGYDHNFVLNGETGVLKFAARVRDPKSGRTVEVSTTEPGLQFYSGNFLDGSNVGKGGKVYKHRYGLCLETQHFPDSPNQPKFPSTVIRPGTPYKSTTIYKFTQA